MREFARHRRSIASGGLKFDVSPQGLLDCAAPKAGSCNGGSHVLAYNFATEIGLTDSSCLPYRGMDHSNWGETGAGPARTIRTRRSGGDGAGANEASESPQSLTTLVASADCKERMCRNCDRFGTCSFVPYNETLAVKVVEHGTVRGVDAMKAEIAARGPIACSMYAHALAFEKYAGGVIRDTTHYEGTTHVVVVAGWGRTVDGVPFWIVRNSFGTNWGELGWYRVEVGKDIYNMESNDCSWAVPDPAFAPELRRRSGMA